MVKSKLRVTSVDYFNSIIPCSNLNVEIRASLLVILNGNCALLKLEVDLKAHEESFVHTAMKFITTDLINQRYPSLF